METILGFSKEYLDSLTITLTHGKTGRPLQMCFKTRQHIREQPNERINVEDLVVWACENTETILPAYWCQLEMSYDDNSKEYKYFKRIAAIGHKLTKLEKKNILRFLKARIVTEWRKERKRNEITGITSS